MEKKFDFSGWATKANIKCSDGRIILPNAFAHNDGETVPLVWNHQRTLDDILGSALLEHRDQGVYAYCTFNENPSGQLAKELVKKGNIKALSIYANQLSEQNHVVKHGNIREVSLVLAGANIGASIQNVMIHGESSEEEAVIYHGEEDVEGLYEDIQHAEEEKKEEPKVAEEVKKAENGEKTVQQVIDTMTEEQKTVMYALVGQALEDAGKDKEVEHSEGGEEEMAWKAFDEKEVKGNALTHADEEAIMNLAKQSGVGSLRTAMQIFAQENEGALQHGIFEDYGELFPEYELQKKGEPITLERDQSWISGVLAKIHKSPFSRIRTRYADARIAELKAKGYQNKGDQKTLMAQIKLLGRTFDPQTIYIKDEMHRDDIIDVTDFSVVDYQWKMMRKILNETMALAALVGDGREDGDPDKIHETHVCSVWNDDELYTIHKDVDVEAAKAELQGSETGAHFGDNYIYAEAIITAALYAREQYKGTGTPDMYCTPHLVNVMLLARDLNGRRIYDSKADLAKALNVGAIHTVEQFEGRTRTTKEGDVKKLLALIVNMNDYQFGSTRGGEITKFEDFDMDFNKQKYLLETRLSGALNKPFAAIALEEPVEA